MRAGYRIFTAGLTIALVASTPLTVLATESDTPVRDGSPVVTKDVEDRPAATDRPIDRITDRPSDRLRERPSDRMSDRPSDRSVKRCIELADNPRRCQHDEITDHINVRQLIWRLIHAHEWKKLIRLLHHLGWV